LDHPVGITFTIAALISLAAGTILFKKFAPTGRLWVHRRARPGRGSGAAAVRANARKRRRRGGELALEVKVTTNREGGFAVAVGRARLAWTPLTRT
jgi:hypothetical protein